MRVLLQCGGMEAFEGFWEHLCTGKCAWWVLTSPSAICQGVCTKGYHSWADKGSRQNSTSCLYDQSVGLWERGFVLGRG